jgi:hypothetical protein
MAVRLLPMHTSACAGVASGFLEVGSAVAAQRGQPIAAAAGGDGHQQAVGNGDSAPLADGEGSFDKGAYFIGKAVWGKGYGTLLQRMKEAKDAGNNFHLDCFGSGEDSDEVSCSPRAMPILCALNALHRILLQRCQLLCC